MSREWNENERFRLYRSTKWDSKSRRGFQRPWVKRIRHLDSLTFGESHSRQIVLTADIVTERGNEEETVGCCIKLNHQMLMGAEVKLIHGQFLTLLSLGHGLSFHAYGRTHNEILNSLPVTTMTLPPIFFSHGFFLTASLKRGASSGLAFWISCWPQLPSGEMSFILSGPCSALPAGSSPA